jgi:hypothetical protein
MTITLYGEFCIERFAQTKVLPEGGLDHHEERGRVPPGHGRVLRILSFHFLSVQAEQRGVGVDLYHKSKRKCEALYVH